ncbi:LXG domain-containing protein [Shouchella patagoniensis]|uniref:LXG domain-containing protein n=1 Tax=Shouchella patagoniensis TaxID=228576 RepID=UPI00099563CB|nr:LXG domain-containing protein [Shouchella patagoniensis]
MKVLDVQEVIDAIDKIKGAKQQDSDNLENLRASIQKIEQLESLQGEGGEALKDHFRRLHVPVLEAFHLLIRQYMEQLDTVKSNLLGFETSSAIVREEFLSGDIKNGLDRIATSATEDANEIESIRTSVSDILALTPFSMDTVLGYVDRGKDHANETIKKLHALDEENEALMTQAESALQEVTNVVNHVSNWSSGGAILSADTLKEIDANLEELYTSLVTEAILMAPPTDEIDWIGQESAMYQQALPLEFLYTGAYANIPGGLESMGWYFMNHFPVSAMVNDEQAIQACAAPEIDHTVDEGDSWWNSMFNFFKGAGSGVVNAAGDAVEGVVNLVTDPVGVYNDTVEFIGAIVDDPALVGEIANELWNAFDEDFINGNAESRGEWTGYAITLIATAAAGDKGISKIANSSQMAKVGRIGGDSGYKTRNEIELRLASEAKITRPSLSSVMKDARVSGVQAISTYAQSMKIGAVMTAGQVSNAIKHTTANMKESLARGMNNLQDNINGMPALALGGVGGSKLPVNSMNIQKIRAGVDDVKKQSVRDVETRAGSGSKGTVKDIQIPSVRNNEFNKWFDNLSVDDFEKMWSNPHLRSKIEDRIRRPGGYHEWHLVARTPQFKKWGVSMDDIKEMRTLTKDVEFINPPGSHGRRGSTKAHNEILKIIDSATDYDSFVRELNKWASNRMKNGILDLPEGLRR